MNQENQNGGYYPPYQSPPTNLQSPVVSTKKPVKRWVVLLVLPFVLAISIIPLQFIGIALGSSEGGANPIISIIQILIGLAMGFLFLLYPLWIIMLVLAISNNSKTTQTQVTSDQQPQDLNRIP